MIHQKNNNVKSYSVVRQAHRTMEIRNSMEDSITKHRPKSTIDIEYKHVPYCIYSNEAEQKRCRDLFDQEAAAKGPGWDPKARCPLAEVLYDNGPETALYIGCFFSKPTSGGPAKLALGATEEAKLKDKLVGSCSD